MGPLARAKRYVPWYAKLGIKLAASRLPIPHGAWHRLGLFQHGRMDNPDYAIAIFDRHIRRINPAPGFTLLELGPGDSLASAVLTKAYGGETSFLVDVAPFATSDLSFYRELARALRLRGLPAPDLQGVASVDELLDVCGAHYLTNGLESLATIDPASVDALFSHAVVEHIPLAELEATFTQMRMLLAGTGAASHNIDLRDHFQGELQSLRFTEKRWESDWFATSGFYTNRLRAGQLCELFERCGLSVEIVHQEVWPDVPIDPSLLAPPFRNLSAADLRIWSMDCLLRPTSVDAAEPTKTVG
jgi:hypothetical protein